MKKVLKIVGLLGLAGIGIGGFWYFQSLKIDGDPLLTACWPVDLYDDVTGEKVVGVEDMDFDLLTGTIFMSAYDRRAVAREIREGKVTTQGGIYTINVSNITDEASLKVADLSREFKEAGNEFRPHGIYFFRIWGIEGFIIINRRFNRRNGEMTFSSVIESFRYSENEIEHTDTIVNPNFCDLYDIVPSENVLFVTDVDENCEDENMGKGGSLLMIEEDGTALDVQDSLAFPNGLAVLKRQEENILAVALTRGKSIQLYKVEDNTLTETIYLPIAPDNLTVDEHDNLYVAGFPNLLDHYFYMKGWFGVEKSPSAAYRISPETYQQTLLFKDNGTMISGATVALRAGDYLILGSAWDDHIVICSGMDGLD